MTTTDSKETRDARSEVSDEVLVVRYRRGDRAAFAELVRRYTPSLYSFAWHQLGEVSGAEAVVVDTFLEVVSHAAEFKHETRFGNWVFGMALRATRARRNDRAALERPEPPSCADQSARGRARQALAQLPTLQREALLLVELGGMRLDDIADLLSLEPATFRTQLGYAIEFLRNAFSDVEEYARALR